MTAGAPHGAPAFFSGGDMQDVPYLRLSAFYFAYYAGIGAFTPYWSLFLKSRGIEPALIGVLMALWYATRILSPGAWSWLAGRSSRPVRWLRIGSLASLLTFVPFLFPLRLGGLVVAMLLWCSFFNAVMPQFEALTLSHLQGRTEQYGRIRVWGSIGFIAVVATFGLVFDHVDVAYLPWLMLPLLGALFAASLRNDYGAAPTGSEGGSNFNALLWRREVLVFLALAFLMQVSFGPYYTFFSLFLSEHGYKHSALGAFWALGVAVEIGVFVLAAPLLARFPARAVVLYSLAAAALRWLVTALWPENVALMCAAQLSHALTFGGFYAACMQLMAEYFPGRAAGHGQGVFYGFSSGVGGVVGALIAGQAWKLGGGALAFEIAGAAALLAAVIAWRELWPRSRASS
jgi:PPP family 3-phenylpropionic acid transporter